MRILRQLLCIVGVYLVGLGAAVAQSSQDLSWVQIESYSDRASVQRRAQLYAQQLDDIAAFQMGGGWYAVLIGPYTRADANQVLRTYRAQGAIPRDSFLTTSSALRQRVFPNGVDVLNGAAAQIEPREETAAAEPVEIKPADETPAQARRSEQLLTREERQDLQIALQWAGYYNSAIDGAFGRGTRASMSAWQAANGFEDTGVLTTAQRIELFRQYNAVLEGMNLTLTRDDAAGIEMKIPTGVVAFDQYEYPFSKYAASGDVAAQLLLISQAGDQASLVGLYDVLQTLEIVPLDGERSQKQGSFEITGQNGDIVSYTQASLQGGEIKGFMLVWPAGDEERRRRVLDEMRASFTRIDGVLDSTRGGDSAQAVDLLAGLQIRKPRLSRSGFFVNENGDVLTTAEAVDSCSQITLDEDTKAQLVASDVASGAALLRPETGLSPRAVAMVSDAAPRLMSDLVLAGYSYEGVLGAPSVTFGTLSDLKGLGGEDDVARMQVSVLDGDVGGPVLDETGSLLGMIAARTNNGRALPEGVSFANKSSALSAFLDASGVSMSQQSERAQLAPEDLGTRARDMTVLVSCWD